MANPQSQKKERGEIFLTNAFSPSMLSKDEVEVYMKKVTLEEVRSIIKDKDIKSFIGHSATAQALSLLLQRDIPVNRAQLKIANGEMIIFTLSTRLQEGQILTSIEEINKAGYTLWYVIVK